MNGRSLSKPVLEEWVCVCVCARACVRARAQQKLGLVLTLTPASRGSSKPAYQRPTSSSPSSEFWYWLFSYVRTWQGRCSWSLKCWFAWTMWHRWQPKRIFIEAVFLDPLLNSLEAHVGALPLNIKCILFKDMFFPILNFCTQILWWQLMCISYCL